MIKHSMTITIYIQIMMKIMHNKKLILFLIILFPAVLLCQNTPTGFLLGDENSLNKINDLTPSGNSISDIATSGDTIWVGSNRGLSVSYDKGNNWSNFYGSEAFGTESIAALTYYNGIIAASTAHSIEKDGQDFAEGSGLRISFDAGRNWIVVPQPLDDPNDTIVVYGENRLRALPVTVAVQNLTYDIAINNKYILIASFAGSLRKVIIDSLVANPNRRWERVVLPPDRLNSVSPTDTLDFCMQPVSGKFCSENNLNYRLFSVIAINDSIIFAGSAGGINKSTDGGISWVKYSHQNQDEPITGNFVVALGFNKYNNRLWAATWRAEGTSEFSGVSTSSNFGESWQNYLEGEKVHNFGFKLNQVLAPADGGMFKTADNGITWITPTLIQDDKYKIEFNISKFYSAAESAGFTWLGSSEGLVRFTGTSDNWEGKWKIYFASQPLAGNDDSYAFPNPFSPKLDLLKIKYKSLNSPVSIRILNFSMQPVRTIIQNSVINEAEPIEYWNGKDENGSIVPNGVYFYCIERGDSEPLYGKIIVLQ